MIPVSTELILPTITIAFVAGVAGMLAAETRASAAVGVAISVTTIPSTVYSGVALATGSTSELADGLETLALNVAFLLIGGVLALVVQRTLRDHIDRRNESERGDPRP